MPKLNVYLFRHGQTTYNRDSKLTGLSNPQLTKKGLQESKIISGKLKNKSIQLAFQTKLTRSKQTLAQVLKNHPECNKIITDNRMIERDYGDFDGLTKEEIIKDIGKEKFETIHRGYKTSPPGGESLAQVEKRVSSFIKDLRKTMKKYKINVAIAAHSNSIRMFRKIMEKASAKKAASWDIKHTEVYQYTLKI